MVNAGAMLDYIAHRDHRLMQRVNRWHAPRWIRAWMVCATRGGDGWLWYTMGAIILLAGGPQRFHAVAAAVLAEGLGVTLIRTTFNERWALNLPQPNMLDGCK